MNQANYHFPANAGAVTGAVKNLGPDDPPTEREYLEIIFDYYALPSSVKKEENTRTFDLEDGRTGRVYEDNLVKYIQINYLDGSSVTLSTGRSDSDCVIEPTFKDKKGKVIPSPFLQFDCPESKNPKPEKPDYQKARDLINRWPLDITS